MSKLLLSLMMFSACATTERQKEKEQTSAKRPFATRTLEFDLDTPGVVYTYRICAKTFLGICTSWVQTKDVYDLNDVAVRKSFFDGNWTCKVEQIK